MPQVAAAVASIATAFGATAATAEIIGSLATKLLVSVAASALSAAMAPKPKAAGIRTSQTLTGGANSTSFVLGSYATNGVAVCPAMSHGKSGKTPNAYLTYVIELSDIPGMTLTSVILDGEAVTLGGTPDPDYGYPVQGRFNGYAWVTYYDGTQTTADATLLAKYGSYPLRPWTSDMIGRGVCYAICTFRYSRKVFTNLPSVRFVVSGIPLYDPRLDSTVGGSGSQRWNNTATWTPSNNPMVQSYNILRGITLPDGTIWGGDAAPNDLPLSEWFAAMNACDATVALAAGGSEPKYRAGFEVTLADEPAAVLEELFKAGHARITDVGGVWKPRVAAPTSPSLAITDDDISIMQQQDYDPFPGLDQTYNGASARFPDPAHLWETVEAPPRYNSTLETEDGGRRLVGQLDLPAAPYPKQVQRLLKGWVNDARRERKHILNLPPAAAILEPLDTINWDSARNGYTTKLFEVAEIVDNLLTGFQQLSLRERNAADYAWSTGDEAATGTAVGGLVEPAAQTLAGFTATAFTINDGSGNPRRPAIKLAWTATELDAVDAVRYQVRLQASGTIIKHGTSHGVDDGEIIVSHGVVRSVAYEARIRPVVKGRDTAWTSWVAVTAGNVPISKYDMGKQSVLGNALQIGSWNIFPDFDMLDDDYYSTSTGAVWNFGGTAAAGLGQRFLNMTPQVSNSYVITDWMQIEPGLEYYASAYAWTDSAVAGSGRTVIWVTVASIDASGVITVGASYAIKDITDAVLSGTSKGEIKFTPAAGERLARFQVLAQAGGTGKCRAGGFKLQRSSDRNLVSDGAVSDKYQTVQLTALNTTNNGGGAAFTQWIILNLPPGATQGGHVSMRGLSFEAKNTHATLTYQIILQRRKKYAGVYGAWEAVQTFTIAANTAYDMYADAATICGVYEDFDYRLGYSSTIAVTAAIKNIYLFVTDLVK